MLMARHHKIAKLSDEDFMVRNDEVGIKVAGGYA